MISWKGIETGNQTIENLSLKENSKNITVTSLVKGIRNNHSISFNYLLKITNDWKVESLRIQSLLETRPDIKLRSDLNGKWFNEDDKHLKHLQDCIDIDISVTPFTNSLPINRLKDKLRIRTELTVLYFDVINWEFKSVKQYYTKIKDGVYLYENASSSFKAKIFTDKEGIVLNYPNLFERVT
ncbi:hypothetical protein GCM10007103_31810 [Salinimicrobium marinum]|uniref:Glycolipid-binding domain-containing protein n=1 Tax=Salinimicrobium marinum TaxID=680283 RepID=A0A918SKD3_9FLAO|nr:putative glycolipid-binding domain-containing protein [Salinimicrobium marinum]GHA48546.1 hypothetical protein GCM10007103_31810 [Salinimicrobium marinum]